MQKAEIVIIGGGVVGASVAYHLTERGCRDVVVIERENSLGFGSTGKATGGVRAQFETDINIRQSLYSLDFFRDWDFDCEYEPNGYLFLATNNRQLDYLNRTGERQRELGYSDVHLVTRDEIAVMVPGMNCDDVVGGSFGPRDGFINPLAVLEGFSTAAAIGGARFLTGVEATKLVIESGRITRVTTRDGYIDCDKVVLASGAWAGRLAATAGVELPVLPQRRQIVWARAALPLPPELPMVIDLKDGFHFRPAREFRHGKDETDPRAVLLAWPDPDEPTSFSTKFDDAFVEKLEPLVRHRAPFLAGAEIAWEKCRAGLYENTPDHHAILGSCEVEGMYFACGFSGHGVMHAPATGRALAEIILDGEASFLDVTRLGLERFAMGELLCETAFI